MAECIEDLNLPNTIIARLIKDALPQGVCVTAEAKSAIARAASVFVLYITNMCNSIAKQNNRKRIFPKDILDTLIELEFPEFVDPLQEAFGKYKQDQSTKKNQKKTSSNISKNDENDGEEEETENDLSGSSKNDSST